MKSTEFPFSATRVWVEYRKDRESVSTAPTQMKLSSQHTLTCGQTSSREVKEVTYECAMVPATGIPNRKPAWTLLVRANPEKQLLVSSLHLSQRHPKDKFNSLLWILSDCKACLRPKFHSPPMYEYLEAVRPPSGPWALRSPISSSFLLGPAARPKRAALLHTRLTGHRAKTEHLDL